MTTSRLRRQISALAVILVTSVMQPIPASARPGFQFPWPATDQHRINSGANSYGDGSTCSHCGDDYYAIDFQFALNEDVAATAGGKVISTDGPGYGIDVTLDHGQGFKSQYAHLNDTVSGLGVGDWIKPGQLVGYAGQTGATAVHLHFEVEKSGDSYKPEPMSGEPDANDSFGNYGNGTGDGTPPASSPYWSGIPSRSDVKTLFDGGIAFLDVFTSTGSSFSGYATPWSSATYVASQVGDRTVAGDFNGDGYRDVVAFRDMGTGDARLHIWLLSPGPSASTNTGCGWWASQHEINGCSGGSNGSYSLTAVGSRVVSGDFSGDGKDDIAVFYDYGSGAARIHVWLSSGSGFTYQGSSGWWSVAGGYTLSKVAGRMVAADFNLDGKDDIATFYDSAPGKSRLHVWISTGTSLTYQGQCGWWTSMTDGTCAWGSAGSFSMGPVANRMVAGDFGGDGRQDVATFYNYGSGEARIHVWKSTGTSFTGAFSWYYFSGGYFLESVADRMIAADFEGGGLEDVATLYDYGNNESRVHVWKSSGSAFTDYDSAGWWSSTSYTAAAVASRVVAGDYNDQ